MSKSKGFNREKRITKALDAVYIGEPKTPIYANILSYFITAINLHSAAARRVFFIADCTFLNRLARVG
jgi:hypothetical protein